MGKFVTGGFPKCEGLFIQTDSILTGEIEGKRIIPHNEKIVDFIAEAVAQRLNSDFPKFPSTKSEV